MGFDITIASVLLITAMSNSAYALVAPFLPFEIEKKGIGQHTMGFVFSVFSVALIIASPLIGKNLSRLGRKNSLLAGTLLMTTSFLTFGMLPLINNPHVFIWVIYLIRFIQGLASAFLQTTCLSIITNNYGERKT